MYRHRCCLFPLEPLTGTVTQPNFETVLAESASEAEATTDGSQVFQPFVFTRSIAFDSETRSQARPQTQTVAQAAATETNNDNTPAPNTRPATRNQSQQRETPDRATANHRPTANSDRPNTAQQTHRETNNNTPQRTHQATNRVTPQRTPPATNRITQQASRSVPQVTTAQASTPAASSAAASSAAVSSAAQTPATTTGGPLTGNQVDDNHRRKPNVGAIVGGVIGALAFLAFLGVAATKYLKSHGPSSGGERGTEEEAAVTQSLMGDFFHQGIFGGAAGGVGGQGAGSGKGAGSKQTGPGGAQGGDGPHDPEMSQTYNNASVSTGNELGPNAQHPQTAGPSSFGENGAYSTQAPSGHPFGGYGTGGAEGVAHGHGAGGGGHGTVPHHAGGGGGSYGNVAPGGGGGGGGGGSANVVAPADGGGAAGNAGAGGGGGAGNAPTAPPGSGTGSGPVGTDVINPTHGAVPPPGGDVSGAAGGHHGPGFIPVIVPVGARKRPTASQSSLINTLPTPYLMTGTATYDETGYPAGAASTTSLMGGNNSGNERSSTDGISRRYSLSDGLYGGPAYGRYEDPFEVEEQLLPSYEARPGASGATRRNEKRY
ncbi:hypothetical protein M407DRAFT_23025 [Tulasnella calospora MUT 4182]|uniref:Uncharacterized protein n=1 Tax=Tulasnella calospora MUT 4182 TaxID=1051891 RepID=A0A0C3QLW0_9AGAM|nr:hypothetical protein M407DRAFT_23025 [Tulasnella calospora MUT 4182]